MLPRMPDQDQRAAQPDFDRLTPDAVIGVVEDALGARCSNICRPLNSYINRVYEVHRADGDPVIAKFYRPGRWSLEALQDEHDFLLELAAEEIPVIAPLRDREGRTLVPFEHLHAVLFPKKGGRIVDEPSRDQWRELGRLIARVHVVGARRTPRDRIVLGPRTAMAVQLESILASGLIAPEVRRGYEQAARRALEDIAPLFETVDRIRIHGDVHFQNLIHRPGESFSMIDFDDMSVGPPVQDVWMLLPGRLKDSLPEMDEFLTGYTLFRDFDLGSLRLIEALRVMRYIHFTAWCARQVADGGFTRLEPDWGTAAYWRRETDEIEKQVREIEDAKADETPLF